MKLPDYEKLPDTSGLRDTKWLTVETVARPEPPKSPPYRMDLTTKQALCLAFAALLLSPLFVWGFLHLIMGIVFSPTGIAR